MKIKSNNFLVIIGLLFLASCRMVGFTSTPGVNVDTYPEGMLGNYIYIDKKEGISDTAKLQIQQGRITLKSNSINFDLLKSDSVYSITHLGDFYYFNFKQVDSSRTFYLVFPLEYSKNYLYLYKINIGRDLKKMRKSGLKETGRVPGEFEMENKAFKKFVEKHLKKKDAIKFERIQ